MYQFIYFIFVIAVALPLQVRAQPAESESPPQTAPRLDVQVGRLVYGPENKSGICFSSGFLDLLARETNIRVDREPVDVFASSDELFQYPFIVMTGEKSFALLDHEVEALRRYVEAGGFILASAGCSNAAWDRSFRREYERIFTDRPMAELTTDHEIFHTVFEIDHLQTKGEGREVKLFSLSVEGRISLVYSPQGLNDTGNAGGGCCCCGGNEIRNAKYINANMLAYALQK